MLKAVLVLSCCDKMTTGVLIPLFLAHGEARCTPTGEVCRIKAGVKVVAFRILRAEVFCRLAAGGLCSATFTAFNTALSGPPSAGFRMRLEGALLSVRVMAIYRLDALKM